MPNTDTTHNNIKMTIIEHEGTVVEADNQRVKVEVLTQSACAGCHAKGQCVSSLDNAVKIIEAARPKGMSVAPGDRVKLSISRNSAVFALVMCYVVPFVVCLSALVTATVCRLPENVAALISLGCVVIYLVILFIFRGRISQKIDIKINSL